MAAPATSARHPTSVSGRRRQPPPPWANIKPLCRASSEPADRNYPPPGAKRLESANILPLGSPTFGRGHGSTATDYRSGQPSWPAPTILQVQSAAEVQHLLACHPLRLLVLHVATAGCPLSQNFQPHLQRAASQHPAALFLTIVVQPAEVVAAAAGGVARTPSDLHPPGSAAERISLLWGLGVGRLPCTLLLRGHELLARVPVGASGDAAPADQLAAALQAAQRVGASRAAASTL